MKDTLNEADYISPEWDNPAHWDDIYAKNEKDGELTLDRDPRYLLKAIQKLNRPAPLKILDAGTGISTMAEFAAYLGHQVVAIDVSAKAIGICRSRKITENDLILCIGHQYNRRYKGKYIDYLDRVTGNPVNLEPELKNLYQPGGRVIVREVYDWNDPELTIKHGSFDIVLNQNGLRCASYDFIQRSFASFYALLKPGGIAIETNINTLIREETFKKYAREAGFFLLQAWWVLYDNTSYITEMNDRDKYILLCWPTG